ncbi:hypothetical protein BJV77DRAFT_1003531 [Russula vinacea]|nr:hypothetical protein BJV77DRAFT_1003531 [Russula vinacea]
MSIHNLAQITGAGNDTAGAIAIPGNVCTIQDCRCPRLVGSNQECNRSNCHHRDTEHQGGYRPSGACSIQDCQCSRFAGDDTTECSRANCRHSGGHHTKRRPGTACSTQGCICPKAIGPQTNCTRGGCGHPVVYHNVAARDGPCVDCDCSEFVGDASTPCGRVGCGHTRSQHVD